jgi:endonuclease V-like protein UPF0215 family
MVKNEIRSIGIDDSPFKMGKDGETNLVGVIYRGKNHFKDVLKTHIKIDGDDSTIKIVNMIRKTKYFSQIKVIFLSGITFGGFNTVDINSLFNETKIPVIVILEKEPDYEKIKSALKKISNSEKKWDITKKTGQVFKLEDKEKKGKIYFQFTGTSYKEAIDFIRKFQFRSNIPEPVRVAHLIAKILKANLCDY